MIDLADSTSAYITVPAYCDQLDARHVEAYSANLFAAQLDPEEFLAMLEERAAAGSVDVRIRHTSEPLRYSAKARRVVRLSTWQRHYPNGTASCTASGPAR